MKIAKTFNISLFFIVAFVAFSCKANMTIKWWSSTKDKKWEEQRNLLWQEIDSSSRVIDAIVYPDSLQQVIDGFGGCFNELGWDALRYLVPKKQERVLSELFSSGGSLKFTFGRLPIGASDYALSYYSLNDSANDYSMENFSIDRDKQMLIPYIKAALEQNSDIHFWASPWTPPAWMKKNKHYACASGSVNNLSTKLQGKEGEDQIIDNDTILNAYAKYFVKYVKEYKKEDIGIEAIHVQNEFNSCQVFPSCVWSDTTLSLFIGKYLGPHFESSKLKTEIWLGTIERPSIQIIDTILLKNNVLKYIKGLGFQWGGKGAIAAAHNKYPKLKLMQTETECGAGKNDWDDMEHTFQLMKHYFNSGANSYMSWNMVLDESGKSTWGWKQNSLITINKRTRKTYYNPEFYLFKHFSGNIPPGSRKVKISGNLDDLLAFVTPHDDLIIILANTQNKKRDVCLKVNDKLIELKMSAHSVNSLQCFNIK